MSDPVFWHRLQFGFTAAYHYLFPQLTMGLALFIVLWKALALRTGHERYQDAARFWIRIFGINFVVGVVTGIPMEFQFGTNWARFSERAGGVIGQTLAMEGMFAFFLESSFLGILLWGEKKLGPRMHDLAAAALFVGSWLSGYFIIATNAFMQHPVGHRIALDGSFQSSQLHLLPLQPVGAGRVRAQHGGHRGHRLVRGGRGGRLLHPARGTSRAGAGSSYAPASSSASLPACWSPSRPATSRARWWPGTSPRPWRRWRVAGTAEPGPRSTSSASPTCRTSGSTIPSACPASSASSPTAPSTATSRG